MIFIKILISVFLIKVKLQDLLRENKERLQVSYVSLIVIIVEGSSKDYFDIVCFLLFI